MFGVVLWSDVNDRKAVIWCEDHGDLAFCSNSTDELGDVLDPGDLIQFDMTVDRHMRVAENPRRVTEGAYEGLADTLLSLPSEGPVRVPSDVSHAHHSGAEIIPFNGSVAAGVPAKRARRTCAAR